MAKCISLCQRSKLARSRRSCHGKNGFWTKGDCLEFRTRKEAVYDAGELGIGREQSWYVADIGDLREKMRRAFSQATEFDANRDSDSMVHRTRLREKNSETAKLLLAAIGAQVE
jgi:hypothetical protein